jgi:hypothetical protein
LGEGYRDNSGATRREDVRVRAVRGRILRDARKSAFLRMRGCQFLMERSAATPRVFQTMRCIAGRTRGPYVVAV